MDFRFSQDDLDLAEGTRAFLAAEFPHEALRTPAASLWPKLTEMGLVGALADESQGGLGLSTSTFALIAEECGRAALPDPLVDVAGIVAPALQDASGVASGAQKILPVHPLNPVVNAADEADGFVVARDKALYLVEASEATLTPAQSIDPHRSLFEVEAQGGTQVGDAEDVAKLEARGAIFIAAQLLGLTAAMIDLAKDYAQQREQFGQPIGKFQAIKHHLATAFVKLEFAKPVVYRAAASLDDDPARLAMHAAHAKVAAGDAVEVTAEIAIQVFGGMGYTFEVDLHYFMKRAWALNGQWGSRDHHKAVLDDALFTQNMPVGPGATFANAI